MKANNIKLLIERVLDTYCTKIQKHEKSSYVELMMDNHKCIEYDGQQYYLPEECSLMDDSDELLSIMILNSFEYEG
jgi:hypothetical protein